MITFSTNSYSQKEVKILFDESYPPYSFQSKDPKLSGNEKAGGIYSAIIQAVFKDPSLKHYKLILKSEPWKAGLTKIKRGKEIGLFLPYFRPKERPYINPYSIPILDENIVFMCRKKIAEKMHGKKWPEDFIASKIIIGRNRGFSPLSLGPKYIKLIKLKKVKLVDGRSTKTSFMMMVKGKTDCYYNDELSIRFVAKNLRLEGTYSPGKYHQEFRQTVFIKDGKKQNYFQKEAGHIGWSKSFSASYKSDLISKIDEVIKKLKENGTIQSIVDKFTK